ncbi:MAG TPA: Uma2 family endonuclease [Thermomicrobiales bacterium]|nr:Uma2 family endonuclease [Thermomicrobiales bacterium]
MRPSMKRGVTMVAVPTRHKFTVDELKQFVAAGVLSEDDRVELIEGDLIDMSPINEPHEDAIDMFNDHLVDQIGRTARVRFGSPVRLSDLSIVQPDMSVVRRQRYLSSHPRPDDVLLLIEVSDTTLSFDLRTKVPLYARSGVPEVWVVDVNASVIHRFLRPEGSIYQITEQLRAGDTLTIEALPNVSLAVADIFDPSRD